MTVLPTVPHVAAKVGRARRPTALHITEGEADKYAAFDAATVALAASGTVTAELALARTPMVVGYKVGGLTFFLSKFLMTVTHITLINIILGREAVLEFLQGACTPQNLADAVARLFVDAMHGRPGGGDDRVRSNAGRGRRSPVLARRAHAAGIRGEPLT